MHRRTHRPLVASLAARVVLLITIALGSIISGSGVPPTVLAQAWEQTIVPKGSGFTYTTSGDWVVISSQNTVQCSTSTSNVIYTRTRTPPNTNDFDWARWTPTIPATAQYDVFVYMPSYTHSMAITTRARYVVTHAGGVSTVVLDQNLNLCSWVSLGRFTFNAGTSGNVYLGDYTGDDPARLIATDGIKFVAAPSTFTLSGKTTDAENNPFANITVTLNTGQTIVTDASGSYQFSGLVAGTYTLTPSSTSRYTFAPASRTLAVSANTANLNFTITNRYSISGRVRDTVGTALPNTPVILQKLIGQETTTTDSNGYFRFYNLQAGLYQVRPSLANTQFFPAVRGWMMLPPSTSEQNFATTPKYGAISGQVTDGAKVLPNAKVNVAGKTVQTDAGGNFSLTGLLPGVHMLEVSVAGYVSKQTSVTIREGETISVQVALQAVLAEGYRMPFPAGTTYRLTRTAHPTGYAQDWARSGMKGDIVVASRDGKVIYVKEDSSTGGCKATLANQGNMVILEHADGSRTVYAHLKKDSVPVKVRDMVRSGQEIGRTGTTGYSCGEHLHFHWLVKNPKTKVYQRAVITLKDITGGKPQVGKSYTSGNVYTPASLSGDAAAVTVDSIAPVGSIQLHLTGEATYQAQVDAFDFDSDTLQMRMASSESELASAPWITATAQVDWSQPIIWVQFKDETDNTSEVYSDTLDPIVYEPIQADFQVEPEVCVGSEPVITNTTFPLSPQIGWQWEFGDGNTSQNMDGALPDPYTTAMYTEPGSYTITLRAAGFGETAIITRSITAVPVPSAMFIVQRVGTTITVTASEPDSAQYQWDFGDGATGTGRVATHTYATANEMENAFITLDVTGVNGCASEAFLPAGFSFRTFLPLVKTGS